jgi:hypothetical protein
VIFTSVFSYASCLKLVLHGFSTNHHVRVALLLMVLPLVEGSLLVCTCVVSAWHNLWVFTHFLDDEADTTPDFRGFFISHEKQIVNCR